MKTTSRKISSGECRQTVWRNAGDKTGANPALSVEPAGSQNRGVFAPKHPRAKPLQSAILYQLIALAECAQVSKENPFAHLVAIEEVGVAIGLVPCGGRLVRSRKQLRIWLADIVCAQGWTLDGGHLVHIRRAGEPVIAISSPIVVAFVTVRPPRSETINSPVRGGPHPIRSNAA